MLIALPLHRDIQVGDTVTFSRLGRPATATITAIDRCPRKGDKFGTAVEAIAWADKDYGFFGYDGGFCYGREITDVFTQSTLQEVSQ